jgi:hypothetical protein
MATPPKTTTRKPAAKKPAAAKKPTAKATGIAGGAAATASGSAASKPATAKPATTRRTPARKPAARKAPATKTAAVKAVVASAPHNAVVAAEAAAKRVKKAAGKSPIGLKTAIATGIGAVGAVATAALLTLRGSTKDDGAAKTPDKPKSGGKA